LDGTGGAKPIDSIQISPDGIWLYLVTNNRDGMHQCNVEKMGRKFPGFGGNGTMKSFGVSADSEYWLQVVLDDKTLMLIRNDLKNGGVGGEGGGRFAHKEAIDIGAAGEDDVIVTVSGGTLRRWQKDKVTDKPIWDAKLEKLEPTSVMVGPGGKIIAVAG